MVFIPISRIARLFIENRVKKTPLWLPMLGVYRGKADEAHSKPRPFEARFLWPIFGKKAPTTPPSTTPRAFLRVRYFDAGGSFVGMEERQMTDLAYCQTMRLTSQVPTDGSATVSVEYEGSLLYRAYFDDLSIALMTEPIAKAVQENHYDPFGLNLKGIETQGDFRWLYNAQNELETLHELDLYETPFRSYDAQLGRFHQADPLAPLYDGISPYQYAYNNPISFNDPMGLEAEASSSSSTQPAAGAAETQETKNHPNGSGKSMLGKIISAIVNFFRAPGAQFEGNGNKIGHDYDNSGGGLTSEGAGSPGGSGKEPQTNSSSNFNQPNTYWIVDLDGVNSNGVLSNAISHANYYIHLMNIQLASYGKAGSPQVPFLRLYTGNPKALGMLGKDCLPASSGYALVAHKQETMQKYAYQHVPKDFVDYKDEFFGVYPITHENFNENPETATGKGDRVYRGMGNAGFICTSRVYTKILGSGCQPDTPRHIALSYIILHVMGHNAGLQHKDRFVMTGGDDLCPIPVPNMNGEYTPPYNVNRAFQGWGFEYLMGKFARYVGNWFGAGIELDD